MTDELEEKDENADATTVESAEKPTGTDQTKTAKTFSQEEINKIVAKEKASWKKSADRLTADHETIVEGLRADIQKRDEVIQQNVDLLRKDLEISDDDWTFISDGKDALQQYDFLLKKMDKANKENAQFPRTPKGKEHQKKFQTSFRPNV